MANRSEHAGLGALVGLGTYAFLKWAQKEPMTLGGAIAYTAGGAAIACVPDILEPALHPNHRALFHSFATAGGIVYVNKAVLESLNISPEAKLGCVVASAAYLSHLGVDATTPRGLPII